MANKLELQSLVRRFREVRALDDFSLEVKKGEFVSLLGPSGCGKTTALRIIAGLDKQDFGNVLVDKKDISHVPANRRNMGMVFQQYSLFPNLTAYENIAFGLSVRGEKSDKQKKKALQLLEMVGLPSHGARLPHQLSGGQQQRIALARALAFGPDILLLDEPLSALDAQVRIQIREEIRRIQLDFGITTVFVTHDQEEAMAISDRVAVMNHGKLEQIDSPSKLYNSPQTSFVASFVGSANQLPGELDSSGSVRVLKQRVGISKFSENLGKGSRVTVLVRPEDLKVVSQREDNATHGVVSLKSFLGPNSTLGVSVGDLPLIHLLLDSKDSKNINVGDEISFVIKADDVMVKAVE
jgi:putative spermidine/putrescine transport system ATP-binding protein